MSHGTSTYNVILLHFMYKWTITKCDYRNESDNNNDHDSVQEKEEWSDKCFVANILKQN